MARFCINKFRSRTGQSLVELLVAMGVFVLVSTAAFFLFFGGQAASIDGANEQIALDYISEGLEAVRYIRNRTWNELAAGDHGLFLINNQWEFGGANDTKGIFTRRVNIADIATNTKRILSEVTWATDPQRPQTVSMSEQLTNWKGALTGGCVSDTLTGNWANPQVIGSADIGSGNSGTDVAIKLPYVFMSGTASTASKPDLFVFDVTNESLPQLVRSVDIGANGINSIFINGNYLYAASSNDNKELIVFDISSPLATYELSSLNLTGSANGVGVTSFASTTVIGRVGSATNELVYINVTNPAAPAIIAESATGGNIYDFYSTNKRLYFTSQESDEDVWVYNIETPASPVFVGNYDIPGTTEDISIYGQEKDGFNILDGNTQNELIVLGASNTAQIYLRDRLDVGGDVNDITCVVGDLIFIATTNSTAEFQIINGIDPDNISFYSSLNFAQIGTGLEYSGNRVYMSVRSNDALKIIGPGS